MGRFLFVEAASFVLIYLASCSTVLRCRAIVQEGARGGGGEVQVRFDISVVQPTGDTHRTFRLLKGEDIKDVAREFCKENAASHDRIMCIEGIILRAISLNPRVVRKKSKIVFERAPPNGRNEVVEIDFHLSEQENDGGDVFHSTISFAEVKSRAKNLCNARLDKGDVEKIRFCQMSLLRDIGFVVDLPPLSEHKVIVMWTPIFEKTDQYEGSSVYSRCKFRKCQNTYDKQYVDIADAVYFWCSNLPVNSGELPSVRRSHQRWIYGCGESPLSLQTTRRLGDDRNIILPFLTDKFNWTMTYDDRSSVSPGWYFSKEHRGYYDDLGSFGSLLLESGRDFRLHTKTKGIAWVASNCNTPSGREHFVRALRHYVDVDVWGSGQCHRQTSSPKSISSSTLTRIQSRRSFSEACPNDTRANPDHLCVRNILRQYKFILALENSVCKDYATEKFYDLALQNGIVPVVLGGSWYVQPSSKYPSFISAGDFDSVEALASYLDRVDKDEALYRSYFRWRQVPSTELDGRFLEKVARRESSWCSLCRKLHEDGATEQMRDLATERSIAKNCYMPQRPQVYTL